MVFSQGANLQATLSLKADQFKRGLKDANKGLTGFTDSLKRHRTSLLAVTGALTGMGLFSVKAAADFETAFTGVRKTVDATEEQFKALSDGIRQMALDLPASTTEIAAVAEAAGQLGIQTDAILGFTKTMIDLGNTTNLSATEAATALARLANITGLPQSQFDRLGATIVELGNNLATTEAEIVEMGLRIAGAGKQVGLAESDILAFAGALSSVGIRAEAGGTAFSRVMVAMEKAIVSGGHELENFARVAGVSASQFADVFRTDASRALTLFVQGLNSAAASGDALSPILDELTLGDVRVSDALRRAAGASDLFTEALRLGKEAFEENNALTKEAAQRYATTASRLRVANNAFTELKIQLGNELIPVLTRVLDIGVRFLDWFTDLPKPVKTFTVILGGVVGGMAALGLVIPPVIALMTTLGITTNIALAGIPLLIAGIVAGVTLLVMKWNEVVDFMKGAGGWILAAFGPIGLAAKLVIDNWDSVQLAVKRSVEFIVDALNKVIDGLNFVMRASDKVAGIFGKNVNEIGHITLNWGQTTERVTNQVADDWIGVIQPVQQVTQSYAFMGNTVESVSEQISLATGDVTRTVKGASLEIFNANARAAASFGMIGRAASSMAAATGMGMGIDPATNKLNLFPAEGSATRAFLDQFFETGRAPQAGFMRDFRAPDVGLPGAGDPRDLPSINVFVETTDPDLKIAASVNSAQSRGAISSDEFDSSREAAF